MPDAPNIAERAVQKFDDAREELLTFLKDPAIREIMEEYQHLVTQYNETLDIAERAVKSHLRTLDKTKLVMGCIGVQKKFKRWYDAEKLANILPAAQADLVLHETVVYTVDVELLNQLTRQGEVDNDLVRKAFHEEEQNPSLMPGSPKPYSIPSIPNE